MNRTVVILAAIILLAPLWFMAVGSLQDIHGVLLMPPRPWPSSPTLDNYAWAFSKPVATWAMNTLVVTASVAVLSVVASCTAGYAFAFFSFPGKRLLWMLLLAGIMVPRISLIIPLFVTMQRLGLTGTRLGVILSTSLSPVGLYLARTYFETVPHSVIESARMDGANEVQVLARIVAPISRPIVTCLALFAAVGTLQDFLWQMLQLQRTGRQTLIVGLMRAVMAMGGSADMQVNPLGHKFAVSMILLAPLVAIFFGASRYFTASLSGAVKE